MTPEGIEREAWRPLVETAQGRYVHVITYYDGRAPIRAQILFRTPEECWKPTPTVVERLVAEMQEAPR